MFLNLHFKLKFLCYFSQVLQRVLLSTYNFSWYVLCLIRIIEDRSALFFERDNFERLGYLLSLAEIPSLFHSFTLIKDYNLPTCYKRCLLWQTFSVNQVMMFSRYMCSEGEIEIYNICKVKQNHLSFGKLIFRCSESTHQITVKMCVVYLFINIYERVCVHTHRISFLCKFLVKTWKKLIHSENYWGGGWGGKGSSLCQSYKVFCIERIR